MTFSIDVKGSHFIFIAYCNQKVGERCYVLPRLLEHSMRHFNYCSGESKREARIAYVKYNKIKRLFTFEEAKRLIKLNKI
jgi:hypothetical protein